MPLLSHPLPSPPLSTADGTLTLLLDPPTKQPLLFLHQTRRGSALAYSPRAS
jgi:hypothetical protein